MHIVVSIINFFVPIKKKGIISILLESFKFDVFLLSPWPHGCVYLIYPRKT